jgi:hypothetical protein
MSTIIYRLTGKTYRKSGILVVIALHIFLPIIAGFTPYSLQRKKPSLNLSQQKMRVQTLA